MTAIIERQRAHFYIYLILRLEIGFSSPCLHASWVQALLINTKKKKDDSVWRQKLHGLKTSRGAGPCSPFFIKKCPIWSKGGEW